MAAAQFSVKGTDVLQVEAVRHAVGAMETSTPAAGAMQLRVDWKKAQSTRAALTLRSHRITGHELPRRRGANIAEELDESRVLVLGVDAEGHIQHWQTMPNPRLVRAEFPGPGGPIEGRVIERDAELLIDLPNDPRITEVRIYQPKGDELTLLGNIPIPKPKKAP